MEKWKSTMKEVMTKKKMMTDYQQGQEDLINRIKIEVTVIEKGADPDMIIVSLMRLLKSLESTTKPDTK